LAKASRLALRVQDYGINPLWHAIGRPGLRETGHYPRPNRFWRPAGVAIGHNQNRLGGGPLFGRRHNPGGHIRAAAAGQFDLLGPKDVLGACYGGIPGQYLQAAWVGQTPQGIADHAQRQGKVALFHAPAGIDDYRDAVSGLDVGRQQRSNLSRELDELENSFYATDTPPKRGPANRRASTHWAGMALRRLLSFMGCLQTPITKALAGE
jgi:hypothetical protein